MMRLALALLVALTGPLADDADARALHALDVRACIEDAGLDGCETEMARLGGARAVAVSPDGRSVYVASSSDDSVSRFDRAADGALTPAGCFEDAGLDGCGNETAGLDGASGVVVSPDGRSVYVTAVNDDALVRFDRAADGALTPAGCFEDAGQGGCGAGPTADVPGLNGARAIAVSPDGGSVYVGSSTVDAAIVRFARAPTGALTPTGCIEDAGLDGCGVGAANETHGLDGIRGVTVSPDGASVYVASFADNAMVTFDRAPDGALTPAGCLEAAGDDCGAGAANDVAGLQGAFGIAVSPDGASVYVSALAAHTLLRFDRAPDGTVIPAGCLEDASSNLCGLGAGNAVPGLHGAAGVAVSPGGASVLVAGFDDSSIVSMRRAAGGAVEFAGCLEDVGRVECGAGALADAPGLAGANGVAVSPDGASVYVASSNDNAIVYLDRELPPICHGTAAAAPAAAPVTVALSCSDPNGDALEVSVESGPAHGSLGAIDQAARSVLYTPDSGVRRQRLLQRPCHRRRQAVRAGDGRDPGRRRGAPGDAGTRGTRRPARTRGPARSGDRAASRTLGRRPLPRPLRTRAARPVRGQRGRSHPARPSQANSPPGNQTAVAAESRRQRAQRVRPPQGVAARTAPCPWNLPSAVDDDRTRRSANDRQRAPSNHALAPAGANDLHDRNLHAASGPQADDLRHGERSAAARARPVWHVA